MKTTDIKLSAPLLKAFIEMEVKDKSGKIIFKREQEAHSWVRNFYNWLFTQAACVAGLTANGLGVTGLNGTLYNNAYCWRLEELDQGEGYNGGAGVDSLGIVVGAGTTTESFESYALTTKIANGETSGKLSYSQSNSQVSTVGTTKRCQWIRYFNNNSGAAITVNEVGIYAKIFYNDYSHMYLQDAMVCRDLVDPGVSIPDTGQLKVTYTIELVYPA